MKNYRSSIFIILAGVILSLLTSYLITEFQKSAWKDDFHLRVNDDLKIMQGKFELNNKTLRDIALHFETADEMISYEKFLKIVNPSIKEAPHIKALSWIARVPHKKRAFYEKMVKYHKNFYFKDIVESNLLEKSPRHDEYFIVYYIAPIEGNKTAIGLNLASSKDRKISLMYSMKTGKLVSTKSIVLVQESVQRRGYLTFSPIYKNLSQNPTTEEREEKLTGFISGVSVIEDTLDEVFRTIKEPGLNILLYEGHGRDPENLRYGKDLKSSECEVVTKIAINTQPVTLIWQADNRFMGGYSKAPGILIGLIIFIIFLAIAFFIQVQIKQKKHIQAEVDLRTNELNIAQDRYRLILNTAPIGIIRATQDGLIESFNKKAEEIFGYTPEEVIGKNVSILTPPGIREHHQEYMDTYIKTGIKKVIGIGREVTGIRKNGELVELFLSVGEVKIGEKSIFTGMLHDISVQKMYEEDLKLARSEAINASKAKSDFLAKMSHEIRTPMNAILGMATLLLDANLDHEVKKIIEIISGSGENLLNIINDILDFSKIESGKLELENQSFNLKQCIDNANFVLDHLASQKGLELTVSIDESCPEVIIGDPTKLGQIIVNLTGNAIKFTEKGSVKISVFAKKISDDSYELNFTIKDTGIGISEENKQKLFQSFTQVDSSVTRKYGGTGLGLIISKKLIEMMGGGISIDSKVGEGTTFYFSIISKVGDEKLALDLDTSLKKFDKNLATTNPLHILIVEDNPVNQVIASKFIKNFGYKPDVAGNGKEALDALEIKHYDLIFMDVQMPIMDGFTASRKIIERFGDKRPKIVAMTANVFQEDKDRCREAGMDDFVGKPLRVNEVLKVIKGSEHLEHINEKTVTLKPRSNDRSFELIEIDELLDSYKGDEDVIPEIIEIYLNQYEGELKKIEFALKDSDAKALEHSAHFLKGAVSNFYAKKTAEMFFEFEQMGRNSDFTDGAHKLNELKLNINKLQSELRSLLTMIKNKDY